WPASSPRVSGSSLLHARSKRQMPRCRSRREPLATHNSRSLQQMRERFGDGQCRANVALAPFTTFKVGGPAEWLLETRSAEEIIAALRIAHASGVPVTMLGGGSNVLI